MAGASSRSLADAEATGTKANTSYAKVDPGKGANLPLLVEVVSMRWGGGIRVIGAGGSDDALVRVDG